MTERQDLNVEILKWMNKLMNLKIITVNQSNHVIYLSLKWLQSIFLFRHWITWIVMGLCVKAGDISACFLDFWPSTLLF